MNGDPFHPVNVRRLRAVGWIGVIGSVVAPTVTNHVNTYLLNHARLDHLVVQVRFTGVVDLRFLLPGLAVLALAEICKRGTNLREAERLTV